jgi:hypothetical protein
VSLPDKKGVLHLVAAYSKIKGHLDAYERGLCVWNDQTSGFDRLRVVWSKSDPSPTSPALPDGHATLWTDREAREWVLFGNPFPKLRCPATFEAWQDASTWELLNPQNSLEEAQSGARVRPHTGSIAWNPWRKHWVTVFMQASGRPSPFGELWYAEAPEPPGPWGPAIKILSHENYTFYNPKLHAEFTPPDSPILLFEGTYTQEFANRPAPTPRYDYNQILYRLDLDDPRLGPAMRGQQ